MDDLLDLTRISEGKIHLHRERLELGDIVRRALDDYRRGFDERRIRLEARFGSGLLWVDGDRTRLAQVLGNVLGNAAKFTPPSGEVEVLIRRRGEQVEIAVRDTGDGIAPELREKLFHPFAQGPQDADRTRGGLGLGLWMAKSLIELHGGSMEAVSEGVGRGSTFTIRLPLQPAPVPAAATPRAEIPGCRILVIEDNGDGADMLRTLLWPGGHLRARWPPARTGTARTTPSTPLAACTIVFREGTIVLTMVVAKAGGYRLADHDRETARSGAATSSSFPRSSSCRRRRRERPGARR